MGAGRLWYAAAFAAIFYASPARAQSDLWDNPSKSDQAWLNSHRFKKASDIPNGGVTGRMTGQWGALGYQEGRLDNDGFVDFSLKSCVPAIAAKVLRAEKVSPQARKTLDDLRRYLQGVKQGAVPYYSAEDFSSAVSGDDLNKSSLACRRVITDIEASLYLDRDPAPGAAAASYANRVVENKDALALMAGHGDEKTFQDRKGGKKLFELVQYKYLSPYELLRKKDDAMMQVRCRLADTMGASLQVFSEGSCDQLWPDAD